MRRSAVPVAFLMVLVTISNAMAYKIFLYDSDTTFEDSTIAALTTTRDNDPEWSGDTYPEPGTPPQYLPPVFWDSTNDVTVDMGAKTSQMTAGDQVYYLQQALDEWAAEADSFDYSYGTSGSWGFSPNDGRNAVAFGTWSDLGTAIGRCLIRVSSSGGDAGEIKEFDIVLNDAKDWDYYQDCSEGTNDLQGTVTHELGHGLGLGHTDNNETGFPTMRGECCYAAVSDCENLDWRSLSSDDTDGAAEIYGPSADGVYVKGETGNGSTAKPVAAASAAVPGANAIVAAYPNPFNPETTIEFELERASSVSLRIYNAAGQVVAEPLASVHLPRGRHAATWRPGSDGEGALATGVYLLELDGGSWRASRKIMLAR